MQLFVPNSPALGVTIKGLFEYTDGVIVFCGTVRVVPGRGPEKLGEANPSPWTTGEVDARLNVSLVCISSGGPGRLEGPGCYGATGGCHVAGAGTHFLKKEVSGGSVAISNI